MQVTLPSSLKSKRERGGGDRVLQVLPILLCGGFIVAIRDARTGFQPYSSLPSTALFEGTPQGQLRASISPERAREGEGWGGALPVASRARWQKVPPTRR